MRLVQTPVEVGVLCLHTARQGNINNISTTILIHSYNFLNRCRCHFVSYVDASGYIPQSCLTRMYTTRRVPEVSTRPRSSQAFRSAFLYSCLLRFRSLPQSMQTRPKKKRELVIHVKQLSIVGIAFCAKDSKDSIIIIPSICLLSLNGEFFHTSTFSWWQCSNKNSATACTTSSGTLTPKKDVGL